MEACWKKYFPFVSAVHKSTMKSMKYHKALDLNPLFLSFTKVIIRGTFATLRNM